MNDVYPYPLKDYWIILVKIGIKILELYKKENGENFITDIHDFEIIENILWDATNHKNISLREINILHNICSRICSL